MAMRSKPSRPSIGLLATALLEDDWNQAAHVRPEAPKVASQLAAILSERLDGDIVCPGLVENEEQADQAAMPMMQELRGQTTCVEHMVIDFVNRDDGDQSLELESRSR